jgi:preprotein translocase subunit SecE
MKDKAKDRVREKASDKDKGRENEGRPQRLAGIRRFVRETRSELKKVVWPTRETAIHLTMIVTAVSIAVGLYLGFVDYAFKALFQFIVGG